MVLITGGTGLIGSHLIPSLNQEKIETAVLSRRKIISNDIPFYKWDISNNYIEKEAIIKAEYIIHLAGANIAAKRFTKKYKEELYNSRVHSTRLLFEKLKTIPHHVKKIISASAIGYYGNCGKEPVTEQNPHADDFLGNMCYDWENEVMKFEQLGIKVIVFRFASMVLSLKGGGLPMLLLPVKYYLGAPVGKGDQIVSWIHYEDLCNLIIFSIKNPDMHGIYNAVAPFPVTNLEFVNTLAKVLRKPIILTGLPIFLLRIFLGELSNYLNYSCNPSAGKIIQKGFNFKYANLENALKALLYP